MLILFTVKMIFVLYLINFYQHHHQVINVATAEAHALLMDYT
jgi:hypothetical protein